MCRKWYNFQDISGKGRAFLPSFLLFIHSSVLLPGMQSRVAVAIVAILHHEDKDHILGMQSDEWILDPRDFVEQSCLWPDPDGKQQPKTYYCV
jgi:hypothetical protein